MARTNRPRKPEWFHCPNCGEEVRVGAKACPACGSDDETGWKEEESGMEAETDEDFDYDAYLAREFPESYTPKATFRNTWAWVLMVLALIGLLAATLLCF